jgi:hypothetical protein
MQLTLKTYFRKCCFLLQLDKAIKLEDFCLNFIFSKLKQVELCQVEQKNGITLADAKNISCLVILVW